MRALALSSMLTYIQVLLEEGGYWQVPSRDDSSSIGRAECICPRAKLGWKGRTGNHHRPHPGLPGVFSTSYALNKSQACQVVVLCGVPLAKQVEINDWTHQNGISFISAEIHGLFGCVTIFLIVFLSLFYIVLCSMTSGASLHVWIPLANNL